MGRGALTGISALLALALASAAVAQTAARDVRPLGYGAVVLMGQDGNVVIVAGPEGALLVDAERAHDVPEMREAVRTRGLEASLNASVAIQARDSLLPGQIDDFIGFGDVFGQIRVMHFEVQCKTSHPRRLRGVAVVDPGTPLDDLRALRARGNTGVRVNLVFGPDELLALFDHADA